MTTPSILQPGQLESAAGGIPELRLPPPHLFADRSQRFHRLAHDHALADYLLFLAALTAWQQDELNRHPDIPLPDHHLLEHCRTHAMPPLAMPGWVRHPSWHDGLLRAVATLERQLPPSGRQAIATFKQADTAWIERQAEALVQGKIAALDLAAAPFIAAALQVQWTHLAQRLDPHQIGRPERPTLCPVCGSHPVASIIRTQSAVRGLRYLYCSLCGSEWHVVRATCSQCGDAKDVRYYGLENEATAVQAEACLTCGSYLKLMHQEKDTQADPVADDIATMALDLLMDAKALAASGNNFFLLKGPAT